jgi:hypothetical protein
MAMPSKLRRLLGLLLVLAIGAAILLPPLQAKRTERRVRAMLLAVQEALQRYHVQEELYPKRMMNGHELVKLLVEGKHLNAGLSNPWTGKSYSVSPDEDWLRYRTDGLAETYELTVLSPGTERVEFRLDSTKHQSLE